MSFVHLRTQTENSVTQGLSTVKGLVKKAKEDNMPAVAITDLNGMFGVIQFYKECRSKGIKPIIGVELTVDSIDPITQKVFQYQITVLTKNQEGYKTLLDIHSRAYLENRTKTTVAVKEDWLFELKDCIVLSGARQGLIGQSILNGDYERAKTVALQMQEKFGDDFYIELQRDGSASETPYMEGAVKLCLETGIAPVATHANHFLDKEDFLAHEARYCNGNGFMLYSPDRPRPFNKEMYFKTTQEMEELFEDIPVAIENTAIIAQKCNMHLNLNKPQLPHFPTPDNMSTDEYFEYLSYKGLEERLIDDFPDPVEREQKRPEYEKRLDYEIKIIQKMEFPGYFLIVGDFIKWAKDNDIPVGPGRGSGAGSLVAYALKITNINPLPLNLLFERFLNPDRVSMPDFDIDFCQQRRLEVIDYVRNKYGKNSVSQISAYGTLGTKSVIKDASRLLGFHNDFADNINKSIPAVGAPDLNTLVFGNEEEGIEPHADFGERYENEADFRKVMDIAFKLEGLLRQIGTHAAGVVIAPTTMSDFSPLFTIDAGTPSASQFDKDDVEAAGLVKFDFLGLKQLTAIQEAVALINDLNIKNGQAKINIDKINMNDPEIFANIFHNGNTSAIFQFEGKGMTSVIQDAKPTSLEDLIAINALYRPGPMDIIPDWLAARQLPEEERQYEHPLLREPLKETCGFMIYQEQVMQCAQIIAGYTLGEADLLRRAMGKKKPEEMAKQRSIFIEGAGKKGVDESTAIRLFDLIEKFSGYGFNKSHAAAYSVLAYQTAFLKHYYPQEFYTATLNSELREDKTEKIAMYVNDARSNNIKVLAADINHSDYLFSIDQKGAIRYGFGALKGIGADPASAIAHERNINGPFTSFYDFLERTAGTSLINKRVVEALVRAGTFDNLHPNRAEVFANIPPALHYISELKKQNAKTKSLLGDNLEDLGMGKSDAPVKTTKTRKTTTPVKLARPTFIEAAPWDEMELLLQEKTAYDYYFSSNPLKKYYEVKLNGFQANLPVGSIAEEYESGKTQVFVAGLYDSLKMWKSQSGGWLNVTDGISTLPISIFSSQLEDTKNWLRKDAFVAMRLELSTNNNDGSMKTKILQMFNWDETRTMLLQKAFLAINEEDLDATFEKLQPFMTEQTNPNAAPLVICSRRTDGAPPKKIKMIAIEKSGKFLDFCSENYSDDDFKTVFITNPTHIPYPPLPSKNKNKGGYKNYNKGRS